MIKCNLFYINYNYNLYFIINLYKINFIISMSIINVMIKRLKIFYNDFMKIIKIIQNYQI